MPRYKILIEYDGRPFYGWQIQSGFPTVQKAIQEACFRMTGHLVDIEGAGRTDTGVHAMGQVAHFDLPKSFSAYQIVGGFNHYLDGSGVSILQAEEVEETFHARFSAKSRQYVYRILNRRSPLTFEEGRAWHVIPPLDLDAMKDAAKLLVGTHDFTTFRSTECQAKNPVRTIDDISIYDRGKQQEGLIEIYVTSRAFLHNQVRIIVGSLKLVGQGKWSLNDLQQALDSKDRTKGGPTAPPVGLYFKKVTYTHTE